MKIFLPIFFLALAPLFALQQTEFHLALNPTPLVIESPNEALYELTLVATIDSPIVDGYKLQACSIELDKNIATIAYNIQGEIHKGGVDTFDVSDLESTILVSRITFSNSQVNHAHFINKMLYLSMSGPSALTLIDTTTSETQTLEFKSFAATHSCIKNKNTIYALSANTGGLHFITTTPTLNEVAFLPLDDARWIVQKDRNFLYVLQGTPGRLSLIDTSGDQLNLIKSLPIPGVNDPEAKSTFTLEGDIAFIAAGSQGTQIMNTQTGAILGSIPIPNVIDIDLEDQMTTALSTENDLLCIAHGGAGLSLYQSDERFSKLDSESELNLVAAGRFLLGEGACANHILLNKGYLYVASGKQGVKIIQVKKKPRRR